MEKQSISFPFNWNPNERSIWRYEGAYQTAIKNINRVTLSEGSTPLTSLPEISKMIGIDNFFVKREDLNPTGSQKDRSAAYLISWALQNGYKMLTISSSGNAAISSAAYCARAGIHLIANISPDTNKGKVSRLVNLGATVVVSNEPIKFSRYLEKVHNIPNLRPSTNPYATEGYKSIAYEIIESSFSIDAIFLYVSSASTLVGLSEALTSYKQHNPNYKLPQIHAVQSGIVNSLATAWGYSCNISKRSIVGDLGVKRTMRKGEAIRFIHETGGSVWYIESDDDIENAKRMLLNLGIDTSDEGVLALSGALKGSKAGNVSSSICLLTGRYYYDNKWTIENSPNYRIADNFSDLDDIIKALKM